MKVISKNEVKRELISYLKLKDNSGILLKEKIKNDLILNYLNDLIKNTENGYNKNSENILLSEVVEYIFDIVSLLKEE